MSLEDTIATRSALRDELRRALLESLGESRMPLFDLVAGERPHIRADDEPDNATDAAIAAAVREVGTVPVVTHRDVLTIVNELFERPLPAPSNFVAEVGTDPKRGTATVIMAAACPECHIAHPVTINLSPELLVDSDGRELRVKAKAKGRAHVCGQLPLPDAEPVADGQIGLDEALDDVAGDPVEVTHDDGPIVLEASELCVYPGCVSPAEHAGGHDVDEGQRADLEQKVAATAGEDDALLPDDAAPAPIRRSRRKPSNRSTTAG